MSSQALTNLANLIQDSQSLLLTTHRHPDGDGLGSEFALFNALKKMGKQVRIIHVDEVPKRYAFLETFKEVEVFDPNNFGNPKFELGLILDANDERLIEPFFSTMVNSCKKTLFVDHHPVLKDGPNPSVGSIVDTEAASTGEIVYKLIDLLPVELDDVIARSLYTSIVFDTQVFKFVRKSPVSHRIASELLNYNFNPDEIHKRLFSNFTRGKVEFLAEALKIIQFYEKDRFAFLSLPEDLLKRHGLSIDDIQDIVDFLIGINSVEIAVVHRWDSSGKGKISLRSCTESPVLALAESFGGGGHKFAAGAPTQGSGEEILKQLLPGVKSLL